MKQRRSSAKRKPVKRSIRRFSLRNIPLRVRLIGLGVAVFVLVLVVYVLSAYSAVTGYAARLGSGTFAYTGQFIFTGQDFLSPLDSNISFSGNYAGSTTPPSADAHFLGNWASHAYAGDALMNNGRLFYNLSSPDMPVIRYRQGPNLVPLQSGQWYSQKLDESLYDNICEHAQPSTVAGKLELYRTIKNLKPTPSPWVNFWSSIGGQPATHVTTTLNGDQLATLWDAIGKATPPGCSDPNTLGFTGTDFQHATAAFDLYSGKTQDQLILTLTDNTLGAKAKVILNTMDYGSAASLLIPQNPIDLNSIFARFGPTSGPVYQAE